MTRYLRAGPLAYFAIAYGATATIQKGTGFVVFFWLAHSLPTRDYATFGLLYALQTGLTALVGAGIIETVIGMLKDHGSAELRNSLFAATNRVFALLAVPAIAIAAAIYALWMRDVGQSHYVFLYVVAAGALTALFTVQASLIRLEEQHRASLAMSFFAPLAGFVGGAVGFLIGRDVASFFLGSALGLLLAGIALHAYGIGFYAFGTRSGQSREILLRILPFILIAVLGWLSGYGNTYLVESLFTATDVAKFTFAYTLSSVMQLVASSLNQVWGPRFLRLVHTAPPCEVEAGNRKFFTLQGAVLGLVGAVMLLIVPGAIRLIEGNLATYRAMNVELLLLFAAYAVSIPWWHAQNYFYAHNKGNALMHLTVLGSLGGLLLWLLAAWTLGAIGVYVGFVMQMAMRTITAVIYARKQWAIGISWQGPAVATVMLGAAAALSAAIY